MFGRKPIQREWLKEAGEIALGTIRMKPKREHLVAMHEQLLAMADRINKQREVMERAYHLAIRKRQAAGLPVPPNAPEPVSVSPLSPVPNAESPSSQP